MKNLMVLLLFVLVGTLLNAQRLQLEKLVSYGGEGADKLQAFASDGNKNIYFMGQSSKELSLYDSVFVENDWEYLWPYYYGKLHDLNELVWSKSFFVNWHNTGCNPNNVDYRDGHALYFFPFEKAWIDGERYVNDPNPLSVVHVFSENIEEKKLHVREDGWISSARLIGNDNYLTSMSYINRSSNNPRTPLYSFYSYEDSILNFQPVVSYELYRPSLEHPRRPGFGIHSIREADTQNFFFVGTLTVYENATVMIAGDTMDVEIPGWSEDRNGRRNFKVLGKVNAEGEVLKYKMWEDLTGTLSINDLAAGNNGDVFMAGSFTGTTNFGYATYTAQDRDIFIAKLDSNFNWTGVRNITGSKRLTPSTIILHESKEFGYLAGKFSKDITFDERYVSADSHNIFVSRFTEDLQWEGAGFIEGKGDCNMRGLDFYDGEKIVAGAWFTDEARVRNETVKSAGEEDFLFAVFDFDKYGDSPFSTEDLSSSTSDLTLYPNPAANGEFRVRCGVGIESAVFYTLSGAEVPVQLSGRGGEELTVRVLTDKKQMIIGKFIDKNGNMEVRKIVVN